MPSRLQFLQPSEGLCCQWELPNYSHSLALKKRNMTKERNLMPCLRFLRKFWRSPFPINSIRTKTGWDLVTIPISFTTCSVLKKKSSKTKQKICLYLHPSMVEASRRNSILSLRPASSCKDFTAHSIKEPPWRIISVKFLPSTHFTFIGSLRVPL